MARPRLSMPDRPLATGQAGSLTLTPRLLVDARLPPTPAALRGITSMSGSVVGFRETASVATGRNGRFVWRDQISDKYPLPLERSSIDPQLR